MINKDKTNVIKALHKKPVNQSLKDKSNRHFDDPKHSLINIQGIGNARIQTEAGDIQFEDSLAILPNDGQANEIEAELRANATHPAQVHRIERERHNNSKIHRYFFSSPAKGWPQFDNDGTIIKETTPRNE